MEKLRTPFQGVSNIVRFNWHFYLLSWGFLFLLFLLINSIDAPFKGYLYIVCFLILGINIISLAVSYYIYDLSGLYNFNWLNVLKTERRIINISAGFDETSIILSNRFKHTALVALDFYDPLKHTEVSIKRARKAYPIFPGTLQVKTTDLQIADNAADKIFVMLSAHEIRDEYERIAFFKELKRVIKPTGQIFIVEHLRDTANFLAYNIGFFHFYSKSTWFKTFQAAQLEIQKEIKLTPFISTFILEKNGTTF
ncbi:methyltransferase domain-containing protein [Chitinophaga sp. MM2321]|uniref:class I SAM-dependent methyltransferase n=1 Tax=Chitinophaga sp. MM2321 TaxID=3137178 RepID=UPI0032D56816